MRVVDEHHNTPTSGALAQGQPGVGDARTQMCPTDIMLANHCYRLMRNHGCAGDAPTSIATKHGCAHSCMLGPEDFPTNRCPAAQGPVIHMPAHIQSRTTHSPHATLSPQQAALNRAHQLAGHHNSHANRRLVESATEEER